MLAGHHILEKDYVNWPPSVKLLITHGENDLSTSSEASRNYIERISTHDKEFRSWPGMLHEGHNGRPELREPFLDFSIRWVSEDSGGGVLMTFQTDFSAVRQALFQLRASVTAIQRDAIDDKECSLNFALTFRDRSGSRVSANA